MAFNQFRQKQRKVYLKRSAKLSFTVVDDTLLDRRIGYIGETSKLLKRVKVEHIYLPNVGICADNKW